MAIALLCLSFHTISEKRDISFSIYPSFNHDRLQLAHQYFVTDTKDSVTLSTLKFYISNIQLQYADGTTYVESQSHHLINIEDEASLKFSLKEVSNKKINKVLFDVGIDSLTNVSGNLEGDIDPSLGMYWAWNSGYINMKLEGTSSSCTSVKKNFQYHIGGYLPNQNAIQHIVLDGVQNDHSITVQADVAKWLNKISLKDHPSIMIPGAQALSMAKMYNQMFSLYEEN